MATIPESAIYTESLRVQARRRARGLGWLGMSALATAGALAGGVAAAWYYRKTLLRLREASELPHREALHGEEE